MSGIFGRGLRAAVAVMLLALPAPAGDNGDNDGALRRPGVDREGAEAVVRGFFAAEVAADGTLVSGAGAISASRISTGRYEVIFRKPNLHVRCWWTGSIAERIAWVVPEGGIGLDARSGTNNGVFVRTYDLAGTDTDMPFMVVAVCR